MSSIQSNNSWAGERWIAGDVGNRDAWTTLVAMKVTWVEHESLAFTLLEVVCQGEFTERFAFNIRTNAAEPWNVAIRMGQFTGDGAGTIPTDPETPGAVVTEEGSSEWFWGVISCAGAVDPGTDWSGDIRWRWLPKGDSTVRHATNTFAMDDVRIITAYLKPYPDVLYSEFRVYDRELTDAEILEIAEARTNPADLDDERIAQWPLLSNASSATDVSGNARSLSVTGTALDDADDPFAGGEPPGLDVGIDAEAGVSIGLTIAHELAFDVGSVASVAAAFGASIGAPLSEARWMTSGHSLTENFSSRTEGLATDAGLDAAWEIQTLLGSTKSARSIGDEEESPAWNGYLVGQNRVGSGLNLITEYRNPASGEYTHKGDAERHDILNLLSLVDDGPNLWAKHNTLPLFRHSYELCREGSPDVRPHVYATWIGFDEFGTDEAGCLEWVAYAYENQVAHDAIANRLNLSLELEGRPQRFVSIPTSYALALAMERALGDGLPGITQGSASATRDVLFSDLVHLTAVGWYLIGCVVYGTYYRRDPRGRAHPVDVTSEQAASLQQVAWDALVHQFDGRPNGPVFSGADGKQAIVDFVPTFCASIGRLDLVTQYTEHFSGTDTLMHFAGSETITYLAPPPYDAHELEVDVESVAGVSIGLQTGHRLSFSAGAVGSVAARVNVAHRLGVDVESEASAQASLRIAHQLSVGVGAVADVDAELDTGGIFVGVGAIGAASIALTIAHRLAFAAGAEAEASARLRQEHRLAVALAARANVTAQLSGETPFLLAPPERFVSFGSRARTIRF